MGAVKFSFNECYGLLLPSHYKYISKFITKSMKLVVIKKKLCKELSYGNTNKDDYVR